MRFICTIFWLAIICAGCASRSASSTQPSDTVAGLKPAQQRAAYTSEQLGQLYVANLAYGDWYLARLAAACDGIAQESTDPRARYEAMRLKAAQGVSVSSILTSPNPIVQVLSLQVLLDLTRLKWVNEGKAVAVFGDRGKLLIDALDDLEKRQRPYALAVISTNEFNAIHEAAQRWRAANPAISDIEFIRFEDFATEMARTLARDEQSNFMSSVQSAAAGISETWLLAARALHLMSRYPRIMQWQLEAQTAEVASRPETRSFFNDMSRMSQFTEEFKAQLIKIQLSFDSFPQKLADSFASGPMVTEALASAKQGIARGEAATKQLAAVEASIHQLNDTVTELAEHLDHLNKTYDPASVQRMAQDVRAAAAGEVRKLVYLIAACVAGLLLMQAALTRWRRPQARGQNP